MHGIAHIVRCKGGEAAKLCEIADGERSVRRVRVDTGAHSRTAQAQFQQRGFSTPHCGFAPAYRNGIRRKLLSEADRHRILHVRAASLQDAVELRRLALETFRERRQHRV